ncbi:MAG: beta-lactamase family protein [Rhodoferax sp.]|nr:beta-lactamase family protein [Rhodoferax sp.]
MANTQDAFGLLTHSARRRGKLALLAVALALASCAQLPQSGAGSSQSVMRTANASDAGMSAQRLESLTVAFNKEIADKALPGAVILVARKGQLVYARAFGLRDPATPDAMQADSIFRIYSMTKPMASVAAMILVEDGRLQLSDPVAKHLPAFKDLKAYTATGTEPARPMTVQDLLRHTSGLGYGEISDNAAFKAALTQAGLYKPGNIDFDARDMSPAEQVSRLAAVPLLRQPGTAWEYSLSTDVLGRVIEAASGQRLGDFMADRIFKPLGMKDTAFHVPEAKASRLTASFDKDPATGTPFKLIDVSKSPGNDSGGAGAVSTAADYLRFSQMMLNGGTLEGQRILSRNTVRWMTSDHLGSRIPLAQSPGGNVLYSSQYTFGLGLAGRPADGLAATPGSAGDYNWSGYAGTAFWVDPKEQIVGVMMMQSPGAMRNYHRNLLRQLVYQAISD